MLYICIMPVGSNFVPRTAYERAYCVLARLFDVFDDFGDILAELADSVKEDEDDDLLVTFSKEVCMVCAHMYRFWLTCL